MPLPLKDNELVFWKDGYYASHDSAEHITHGPESVRRLIARVEKKGYEVVGIAVRGNSVKLLLHDRNKTVYAQTPGAIHARIYYYRQKHGKEPPPRILEKWGGRKKEEV